MPTKLRILDQDNSVNPSFLKAVNYIIEKHSNAVFSSVDKRLTVKELWPTEFKSTISNDWLYLEFENSLDAMTFSLKFN